MHGIIRQRLANADISGQGAFFVFDPALWKIRRKQLVAALEQYVRFAVKDAMDGYETLAEYLQALVQRLPFDHLRQKCESTCESRRRVRDAIEAHLDVHERAA